MRGADSDTAPLDSPSDSSRLDDRSLARLIDVALDRADAEAPLWDALDAAVDALGPEAVRHHLLQLADRAEEAERRAA